MESLVARAEAGVDYFMLHPLVADPDQLDLWTDLLIKPVQARMNGRDAGAR